MPRQRYDYKARCCTECGCLMTPEAFEHHNSLECFEIKTNEEKFKKEEQNELPDMRKPD